MHTKIAYIERVDFEGRVVREGNDETILYRDPRPKRDLDL